MHALRYTQDGYEVIQDVQDVEDAKLNDVVVFLDRKPRWPSILIKNAILATLLVIVIILFIYNFFYSKNMRMKDLTTAQNNSTKLNSNGLDDDLIGHTCNIFLFVLFFPFAVFGNGDNEHDIFGCGPENFSVGLLLLPIVVCIYLAVVAFFCSFRGSLQVVQV